MKRIAGSVRLTGRCLLIVFGAALISTACVTEQGTVDHSGAPPPSAPPADVPVPLNPPAEVPPSLPPPPSAEGTPAAGFPKTIQDSGISSAALYLYKQAQASRAAGHADQALASLQRAVHVDPRNPFIWQALADTQLNLQQPDQAEAAAQKSSSLARGNPYVDAGNWRIIAAARQALGDSAGAVRAQAQADQVARALSAAP